MTPQQIIKNDNLAQKPYIGALSRDMTTATGSQAITGLGFSPTMLVLAACVDGNEKWSIMFWNWQSGWTAQGIAQTSDTEVFQDGPIDLVGAGQAWPTRQTITLTSFDSDGFTLAWTKTGAVAAGTAHVKYIAFP